MKEYKKSVKHGIYAAIAAFMLLAGCSGSEIQESAAGQTKAEESSVEVIDFNEDILAPEQELKIQEPETPEAAEQQSTVQSENTETAEDTMVKKQPPEGFELKFASDDWGLSFGEPGTQSVGNASAEDLAWYDAYYVGNDSEKVIYLTFDCGYENGNTEPILDALKKHNVKATFFVVGHFLETAPDLVKRMAEEGHAVGNHTYHHPDMSAISNKESFQKELNDVADLFYEITGKQLSKYYRPPQGKCNAENVKMAQEAGYSTIFWSLAYVDWDTEKQPSHAEAFDKLTTRIHPGAIVLLHNTSQTNGEILDELLTKWEDMGYTFKPLSELTLH